MDIKTLQCEYIKSELKEGLKECNFDSTPYSVVKETLESLKYRLSESDEHEDYYLETNGWECDYFMFIWKDCKYTGYVLKGSLYYGDNEIVKWN